MGVPSPVWGPLRGAETKRVGAHAAVVSMVVTPTIPSALVQHLNDEVLLKVRPHPDDTARTLQERIARTSFFDDFRVLHVKGGSKYVHLNRTGMSQTRRITFSEPLSAPYRDDDGDLVQELGEPPVPCHARWTGVIIAAAEDMPFSPTLLTAVSPEDTREG